MKLKFAGALGLLSALGAGYYGYQHYGPPAATVESDSPDDSEKIAAKDRSGDDTDEDEAPEGDPFANTEIELADGEEDETRLAREPGRPGHPKHAAPLPENRHKANHKSSRSSSVADTMFDDEESSLPQVVQNEPDEDDDEVVAPPPNPRSETLRSSRLGGNHSSSLESAANRHHTSSGRAASGPRIAGDDDEPIRGPRLGGFDDDEIESPATHQHAKNRNQPVASRHKKQPIRIVEVTDDAIESEATEESEKLDGFTNEESTTRRAVAKTRLIRPTAEDLEEEDRKDEPIERKTSIQPKSGATAIMPRGSAHQHTPKSTHRPVDDDDEGADFGTRATHHSHSEETYRVLPDDSFWKISRKIYGSAKYHQALIRHNQDRVSEPQKLRAGMTIATPTAAYLERHYPQLIEKSSGGSTASSENDVVARRTRTDRRASGDNFDESDAKDDSNSTKDGFFFGKSGAPMYRIGPDDTLSSIAQRHLGRASRWIDIYEQNQQNLPSPDNLTVGTVIRLPDDASRVSLVPENSRRR